MAVISIAVQKGGSGKTTTAINLGAALKQMGFRVLLIDVDPQANLTHSMGLTEEELETRDTIYNALVKEGRGETADLRALIEKTTPVDLVPAGLELATVEMELASALGREQYLKNLLKPLLPDYDFILIDCPPSVGLLTVNALVASDGIVTPLQSEFLPLKGLRSFEAQRKKIQSRLNPTLELIGIVLSRYSDQLKMHRGIYEQLQEEFSGKLFRTKIRTNIALAHAQQAGVDIFTYDKLSNGAEDYLALAREFLERLPKKQ